MGNMAAVRNCPAAAIILFGCERPAHLVALHLSRLYGINVLCREEGYLETGYVTCEMGGNNRHSPLTNWDAKCQPSASKPIVRIVNLKAY